jgi:hypothetical protein
MHPFIYKIYGFGVEGFEPPHVAFKERCLILLATPQYTVIFWIAGLEPTSPVPKTEMLPITPYPVTKNYLAIKKLTTLQKCITIPLTRIELVFLQ